MRLIDADVVYKILNDIGGCDAKDEWSKGFDAAIDEAIMQISNAPTIEAEPVRHGHWCGTVCSACGESTSFYYDCTFCPNCGAKMDGGIPDETIRDKK